MLCFMFPGQPLAEGPKLPSDHDAARVAKVVGEVAGFDLESRQWLREPASEAVRLHLLGVAHSLYLLRRRRAKGFRPDLVAQHSMGIYAALAACGCIDEREAVEITFRVGVALAGMREQGSYAFGCLIGLPLERVLPIARNNGVYLANRNTSRHFLLSGDAERIDSAVAEARESGAYSAQLFPGDAPIHTPLIEKIEDELKAIFCDYRFFEPAVPLMSHLDQRYLQRRDIGPFLLRELCLPVHWEKTYRALKAAGAREFAEVGTGDSLAKYNRWIESET